MSTSVPSKITRAPTLRTSPIFAYAPQLGTPPAELTKTLERAVGPQRPMWASAPIHSHTLENTIRSLISEYIFCFNMSENPIGVSDALFKRASPYSDALPPAPWPPPARRRPPPAPRGGQRGMTTSRQNTAGGGVPSPPPRPPTPAYFLFTRFHNNV